MRKTTRDRLVLPILLPVGIIVIMVGVLWGFSRILLSVSHDAATVTALAVAIAIVVAGSVLGSRQIVRLSSLGEMVGVVAGVAMLAGGVAVASLGTEAEGGGGEAGTSLEIVAVNLAFQPTSITVPAGKPFQIVFTNQDTGVQHNVQIFDNPDLSGTPLFSGDLVTGPGKVTYDVPALDAGTYAFNCVVHPSMTGTMEAAGSGADGGGGGPSVTVTAQNVAFDTDTISLPADTASTIVFDNRDAGIQHNIAIFEDDTMATVLFRGELVTGPGKAEYQIPPLPAGEYYFHCDVHPNMNGTVVVGGDGGGSGGGPTGGTPTGGTPTGASTSPGPTMDLATPTPSPSSA